MPEMTMLAAINDALHVAMAKDDGVVCLGETAWPPERRHRYRRLRM